MTTNITTSAQPTSGSSVRLRKRQPTAAVKPARIDHPQQDRALERRPHGGDVVERRRRRRADLLDVGQREVAGDQRPLHHDDREHGARRRTARRSAAPCAARRSPRRIAVDRADRAERSPRPAASIRPARPSAPFRLAASTSSDSASRRRPVVEAVGVLGLVLVGVLDLDAVALERAVDELAVDDDRLALLEDAARLAVVAHGQRRAVEGDRERR